MALYARAYMTAFALYCWLVGTVLMMPYALLVAALRPLARRGVRPIARLLDRWGEGYGAH